MQQELLFFACVGFDPALGYSNSDFFPERYFLVVQNSTFPFKNLVFPYWTDRPQINRKVDRSTDQQVFLNITELVKNQVIMLTMKSIDKQPGVKHCCTETSSIYATCLFIS